MNYLHKIISAYVPKYILKGIILFSVLHMLTTNVQSQFILTDKTSVEFVKVIGSGKDFVEVKTRDKERVKLEIDKIVGKIESNLREGYKTLFYRKPIVDGSSSDYEFLEKKLEGRINVYERLVESYTHIQYGPGQYGSGYSISYYLFLEKAGEYKCVLDNSLFTSKTEMRETLKNFVKDNEVAYNRVSKEDFKMKFEDILEVVKEYNIAFFEAACTDNCVMGYVQLYSDSKKTKSEILNVTVNDSATYQIPYNKMHTLRLCNNHTSRVVVESDGLKSVELLSGSPYYIQYFVIDNKKKIIEVKRKTDVAIQRRIQFIAQGHY